MWSIIILGSHLYYQITEVYSKWQSIIVTTAIKYHTRLSHQFEMPIYCYVLVTQFECVQDLCHYYLRLQYFLTSCQYMWCIMWYTGRSDVVWCVIMSGWYTHNRDHLLGMPVLPGHTVHVLWPFLFFYFCIKGANTNRSPTNMNIMIYGMRLVTL